MVHSNNNFLLSCNTFPIHLMKNQHERCINIIILLTDVLILALTFIAVYFGMRFLHESFTTNDGNLLFRIFQNQKIFWDFCFGWCFSLYHHHRKRSACETKHYTFSCLFNSLCINVYLHRNYVRNSSVYPSFHYIVIDLKNRHFENSLINTIFAKLIQNTNDRNSTTRMDQCYRVRPFPIQTQFKRGMAIP